MKTRFIQVRVDEDTFELVHEFSADSGMPVAELMRRALAGCLERNPDGNGWTWFPPGSALAKGEAVLHGRGAA